MKTIKTLARCYLAALMLWGCAKDGTKPQDGGPDTPGTEDPYRQIVTDAYRPYISQTQAVGISIGISVNGEEYFYNMGELVRGTARVPDEHTVYEIGSISKTFAAIMAVDFLREKGITVDEKIGPYLPSDIPVLERGGQEVTFKHLLNHTAGLPREPANFSGSRSSYDSLRLYEALKLVELGSTPGSTYLYSNFGFGTLSTIIERNIGMRYGQKLENLIAAPLNLTRTKTRLTEYPDWGTENANIAVGYSSSGNQVAYRDPNETGALKGSGAVHSTIKDLLAYGRHQIDTDNSPIGHLALETHRQTMQSGSTRKGLAWTLRTVGGLECLHHDGATNGFNAALLICKSNNTVIAVLANNGGTNINSRMLTMAPNIFDTAR
ncbi:CubicO group peptidase, beta-lactamase class C family [Parapedobacter composti]|uniref:Beta-lactamase n=1 Tax=Parapedobacter composti TaxID=623281 RepID=A0A1I1K2V2_9SPHI|nr:serine hydrolase domain-containing protein [Parapedobacter composti]SFC54945.1 CubicO group peptidase, beta-lactamase class C family [Parapedobacter composti]